MESPEVKAGREYQEGLRISLDFPISNEELQELREAYEKAIAGQKGGQL